MEAEGEEEKGAGVDGGGKGKEGAWGLGRIWDSCILSRAGCICLSRLEEREGEGISYLVTFNGIHDLVKIVFGGGSDERAGLF